MGSESDPHLGDRWSFNPPLPPFTPAVPGPGPDEFLARRIAFAESRQHPPHPFEPSEGLRVLSIQFTDALPAAAKPRRSYGDCGGITAAVFTVQYDPAVLAAAHSARSGGGGGGAAAALEHTCDYSHGGCADGSAATHFCEACGEKLCAECYAVHGRGRGSREHAVKALRAAPVCDGRASFAFRLARVVHKGGWTAHGGDEFICPPKEDIGSLVEGRLDPARCVATITVPCAGGGGSWLAVLPSVGSGTSIESPAFARFWDAHQVCATPEGVVWQDGAVPPALCAALTAGIDALAAATPEPDYHPHSRGIVRDHVHPALYAYVKGVSPLACPLAAASGGGGGGGGAVGQAAALPFRIRGECASASGGKFWQCAVTGGTLTATWGKLHTPGQSKAKAHGSYEAAMAAAQKLVATKRAGGYVMDDDGGGGGSAGAAAPPQQQQQQQQQQRDAWGRDYEDSAHQWLPTYFDVSADGAQCTIRDYINNIVPRAAHEPLYDSLAALFLAALPALEGAYSYGLQARTRLKPSNEGGATADEVFNNSPGCDGPVAMELRTLRGCSLQVITKVVDYELGEEAAYEGVWHVEGMSHENVVATCDFVLARDAAVEGGEILFKRAFFRDEANSFVESTGQERARKLDEIIHAGLVPLGRVPTPQGRLVCFPNSHVHKVARMSKNSSSGGGGGGSSSSSSKARRRIVVFFLIDPSRRIVSTREVAPQQQRAGGAMSLAAAKAHRLALMNERKHHKQDWNVRSIELCEH